MSGGLGPGWAVGGGGDVLSIGAALQAERDRKAKETAAAAAAAAAAPKPTSLYDLGLIGRAPAVGSGAAGTYADYQTALHNNYMQGIRDITARMSTGPTDWEKQSLTSTLNGLVTGGGSARNAIDAAYGQGISDVSSYANHIRGGVGQDRANAGAAADEALRALSADAAGMRAETGSGPWGHATRAAGDMAVQRQADMDLAAALSNASASVLDATAGGQWGLGAEAGAQNAELGRMMAALRFQAEQSYNKQVGDRLAAERAYGMQAQDDLRRTFMGQLADFGQRAGQQATDNPQPLDLTGTLFEQQALKAYANGNKYTDPKTGQQVDGTEALRAYAMLSGVPEIAKNPYDTKAIANAIQYLTESGNWNATGLQALGFRTDPAGVSLFLTGRANK